MKTMNNEFILKNAKLWSKGEECEPLEAIDISVLGEYLDIKIPQCFHHFISSDNPNHIRITGAEKTIFKTLTKIKNRLEEL